MRDFCRENAWRKVLEIDLAAHRGRGRDDLVLVVEDVHCDSRNGRLAVPVRDDLCLDRKARQLKVDVVPTVALLVLADGHGEGGRLCGTGRDENKGRQQRGTKAEKWERARGRWRRRGGDAPKNHPSGPFTLRTKLPLSYSGRK